jgi:hypothetical protein
MEDDDPTAILPSLSAAAELGEATDHIEDEVE